MNTTMLCWLLLLAIPFTILAAPSSTQINFINGDLREIQYIAAREGKPLLVHFTASWCMPCQWMEKNTFRDTALAAYANDHYLALKIDIDDAKGTFYKEQFTITHLPSLLLFNSQGVLLDRQETSLEAPRLLEILKMYNRPQNRVRIQPQTEDGILNSPTARLRVVRPALLPEAPPERYEQAAPPTVAATQVNPVLPSEAWQVPRPSYTSAPRFRKGFGIQTGLYAGYDNAVRQVNALSRIFDAPVNILATHENGRTRYRIMIGPFDTREKAQQYLLYVQRNDIEGFVREIEEVTGGH